MPRLQVPSGPSVRADRFLAGALDDLSRRQVQRLLSEGAIRIDGRVVRKGEMLAGGRLLEVEIEAAGERCPASDLDLALAVLYEDEWLVAIDKPPGRPSNALRAGERGTVASFLVARFPETVAAGAEPLEAGLVHRLDVDTSGVLLAARRRDAWVELRRQFRRGEVEKRYLAVVHGAATACGEIRRAIIADAGRRERVRVLPLDAADAGGRPALTRYRRLERLGDFSLLEIEIPTGARHQIRAHMAAIGHPVVGDVLYGPDPINPLASRQLLHAAAIAVAHPASGQTLRIESQLPADFQTVLEEMRRTQGR